MNKKDVSNQADLLDMGFDLIDDRAERESTKMISPRAYRHKGKMRAINGMKKETLDDLIKELPEEGEYVHLVSNGKYDYYTFIPVFIDKLGHIDELWGSTWTMNRSNCEDLFNQFDAGKIAGMNIITGLYFKRRETAVYASLVEGMAKRKQKVISCNNHAKVVLIRTDDKYYVIEGSANWTGNPRIEQNVLVQSRDLFEFHKGWMEEYIG
ncbi:MAG: hypothetical protein WC145_12715 [Aliarcobacter sp.]|nr:hypothetical protein [Eubacteriales bacterium]MDD4460510.1 hypothetical protein [Proteiniphilum sp.]